MLHLSMGVRPGGFAARWAMLCMWLRALVPHPATLSSFPAAEMSEAAGAAGKPLILINPKLGDIQSGGQCPACAEGKLLSRPGRVFQRCWLPCCCSGPSPSRALVAAQPEASQSAMAAAGGVMSVRGRQGRMDFTSTFVTAYHFRLLCELVARQLGVHPDCVPCTAVAVHSCTRLSLGSGSGAWIRRAHAGQAVRGT